MLRLYTILPSANLYYRYVRRDLSGFYLRHNQTTECAKIVRAVKVEKNKTKKKKTRLAL